ncbi:MAG: site-specific integrase [Actinomycetota bacterium]|nr:site-specific integrase [Actinomycetota bacterium]
MQLRHGKGGKEDVLPLAFPDLRTTLYLHLEERGGALDEFLLFSRASRMQPLSAAGIDQWFRRCVARAGLVRYTTHQLRHPTNRRRPAGHEKRRGGADACPA